MSLVGVKSKHDLSISEKQASTKVPLQNSFEVMQLFFKLMSLIPSHKMRKNYKEAKLNNRSAQHF